jgi:hypothetical protein
VCILQAANRGSPTGPAQRTRELATSDGICNRVAPDGIITTVVRIPALRVLPTDDGGFLAARAPSACTATGTIINAPKI